MLVSKTVTLDAEDVVEIQKSVDRGQADNDEIYQLRSASAFRG